MEGTFACAQYLPSPSWALRSSLLAVRAKVPLLTQRQRTRPRSPRPAYRQAALLLAPPIPLAERAQAPPRQVALTQPQARPAAREAPQRGRITEPQAPGLPQLLERPVQRLVEPGRRAAATPALPLVAREALAEPAPARQVPVEQALVGQALGVGANANAVECPIT